MLIDLHCHTLPLSQCSSLVPEELVDLARERGLDGVVLTEHDSKWDEATLAEVRKRTKFLLLAGVELTTDRGHVLAYGLRPGQRSLATLAEAREAASADGALLYLAHPARDGLLRMDHEIVTSVVSVEAVNGSDTRLQNVATRGLAHGFPLPGIGGSDAHTLREVGRAATRFEARIENEGDLLAALRSGKYEAVMLD
ncbi:MAG: CehA/McbA family metallohydrolase [Dehalococcoidia bacterium]|nr:CehA/McbA family metallohydrolase [Dehalococcoidia bacterium]